MVELAARVEGYGAVVRTLPTSPGGRTCAVEAAGVKVGDIIYSVGETVYVLAALEFITSSLKSAFVGKPLSVKELPLYVARPLEIVTKTRSVKTQDVKMLQKLGLPQAEARAAKLDAGPVVSRVVAPAPVLVKLDVPAPPPPPPPPTAYR